MKLADLLKPTTIVLDLKATSKREALMELCGCLAAAGELQNAADTVKILLDREALGSTGIGQGVAIPHAKCKDAPSQVAALGLSRKGIEFDALDGEPVFIMFLLVAPPEAAGNHLKALAKISRLLKDKFFRQSLREVKSVDDALRIIREEDDF